MKRLHLILCSILVFCVFKGFCFAEWQPPQKSIYVNLCEDGDFNGRVEGPIFLIYYDPGLSVFGEHALNGIFALYQSGDIIWSEDIVFGGPPYYCGKIEKAQIDEIIFKVIQLGVLDMSSSFNYPPDAGYVCMKVCIPQRLPLELRSWHELQAVSCQTSKGSIPDELYGDSKVRLPCDSETEFYITWRQLKSELLGAIPKNGVIGENIKFEYASNRDNSEVHAHPEKIGVNYRLNFKDKWDGLGKSP